MAWQPGPIRRAWYNWKMMKFPWRKRWLVGFDLQGNTFWEFKDNLNSNRFRRIAKYRGRTHHGDVNVSPSWMQWLRHTRYDPPSLSEQQSDIIRQERIKLLAAQADERWASKPSFLDPPSKQQPVQMLTSKDPDSGVVQTNAEQQHQEQDQSQGERRQPDASEEGSGKAAERPRRVKGEPKDSPWKKAQRGGPGEDWQPDSWTPGPAKRRA